MSFYYPTSHRRVWGVVGILLVHESMIILKPAIFDQMAVVSSVTRRLDYSLNFWPFIAMNICPTAWEVY